MVVGLKDLQTAMAEAQQTSGEDYSGDWGERHDEELDAQQTSGEDYSGDWGERHDEQLTDSTAQQTSGEPETEPEAAPQAAPYTELPGRPESRPRRWIMRPCRWTPKATPWSDAGRNSRQNRYSPGMNNRFCMENWVAECINFANKNEKM